MVFDAPPAGRPRPPARIKGPGEHYTHRAPCFALHRRVEDSTYVYCPAGSKEFYKRLRIDAGLVKDGTQRPDPQRGVIRDAHRGLGIVAPEDHVTPALMKHVEPATL